MCCRQIFCPLCACGWTRKLKTLKKLILVTKENTGVVLNSSHLWQILGLWTSLRLAWFESQTCFLKASVQKEIFFVGTLPTHRSTKGNPDGLT